jgi:hypothetical protein
MRAHGARHWRLRCGAAESEVSFRTSSLTNHSRRRTGRSAKMDTSRRSCSAVYTQDGSATKAGVGSAGFKQGMQIAERILALTIDYTAPLTVTGHDVRDVDLDSLECHREPDGITRRIDIIETALLEDNPGNSMKTPPNLIVLSLSKELVSMRDRIDAALDVLLPDDEEDGDCEHPAEPGSKRSAKQWAKTRRTPASAVDEVRAVPFNHSGD